MVMQHVAVHTRLMQPVCGLQLSHRYNCLTAPSGLINMQGLWGPNRHPEAMTNLLHLQPLTWRLQASWLMAWLDQVMLSQD